MRPKLQSAFPRTVSVRRLTVAFAALIMTIGQASSQALLPVQWTYGQFMSITSVAYSPNGSKLAVGGIGGVQIIDVATGKSMALLTQAQDGVNSVAWSPDGHTLAVGGQKVNGVLELWNPATFTLKSSLPTSHLNVTSVAYSPDGKTVLCGGRRTSGAIVEAWNVATSAQTATYSAYNSGTVTSVTYSRDGKMFAIGGTDIFAKVGFASLWDSRTGKQKGQISGNDSSEAVESLSFSPDGRRIAVAGSFTDGKNVELWDTTQLALISSLSTSAKTYAAAVAYSPDGKTLAIGGNVGSTCIAELWDTGAGTLRAELPTSNQDQVLCVCFSPYGLTMTDGGVAVLETWKVTSGQRIKSADLGPGRFTTASVISADGSIFADGGTGPYGGSLELGAVAARQVTSLPTVCNNGVVAIAFSPDGTLLASGGQKFDIVAGKYVFTGVVEIWDVSHRTLQSTLAAPPENVTALAFGPDGKTLAVGGANGSVGTIQEWDVKTLKKLIDLFPDQAGGIDALAWDINSDLASATHGATGPTVQCWNEGENLVGTYHSADKTTASIVALCFSPDAKKLAFGGFALRPTGQPIGSVEILDLNGSPVLLPVDPSLDSVRSIAFTPDGFGLIAAGASSIQTFSLLNQTLQSNFGAVALSAFAASSKGTQCVYACENGTVSIAESPYKAPLLVKNIAVNPPTGVGGTNFTGKVTLTQPAGKGGATVALTVGSDFIQAPNQVIIPAGATEVTFDIGTSPVTDLSSVGINATFDSVTVSTTVNTTPPPITAFTLSSAKVVGGKSVTATVTISAPAGPPGDSFNLMSSNEAVVQSSWITIPAGKTSVTFSIATSAVNADTPITLRAVFLNTKSVTLTVLK